MIKLTPVFQEHVERGMRFREYFYLCVLIVFSIYQLSGIGGSPGRTEIIIYFILTILFMLFDRRILSCIRSGRGTEWFTVVSVGKDIFSLTFLVHLTGGMESPFIFLYFLVAIGIAAAMGFMYGLYVLIAISIFFFGLVYMEYSDLIMHHQQYYYSKIGGNYKNIYILIALTVEIFIFGILAVFSNRYIARRLRLREKELSKTVEELDKINKQLEQSQTDLINLTSQIELQKELLDRTNKLQKILYNITSHLVEQYSLDVLIHKIHNEITNMMPVIKCALLFKDKTTGEFFSVSSVSNFLITDTIIQNFNKTIELNDLYLTENVLLTPVKRDVNHEVAFLCERDPHSRQLRDEEIRVVSTIARQLSIFIDRLNLYEKLQYLSNTDGLTGLYNHRFFHIRLEEELARCRRHNKPLSLIIMDMDNFKEVNDNYGHQEGDKVLSFIAGLLKEGFRSSDVVARYGGDEFVAILPETDKKIATHIAERILEKIKTTDIPVPDKKLRLSVCIGISSVSPEEGLSSRELVSRVDSALYEAKKIAPGTIKSF